MFNLMSLIPINFHLLVIHIRQVVQTLYPQQYPHPPICSRSCCFFPLCICSHSASSGCGYLLSFSIIPQHCSNSLPCSYQWRSSLHSILPQCITLCIQCSPGSVPFTLHQFLEIFPFCIEFHHYIIPFSTITNIYHIQFSHSPIEGHSFIFQFFATTKCESRNILVPFVLFMTSLGYRPHSGMAGRKARHSFIALWA